MSQKDSSSKIKAQQPGGSQSSGRRTGSTRYKMQAAQIAQQEAAKAQESAQQEQLKAVSTAASMQQQDQERESEDNVRGLWKSRVLASYKGKSPKDSQTLLAKVPDGKGALQVSEHYKAVNVQEVMIATVDKMFDIFQNCAYEFNKIAAGSELELNWIRPFLSKEVTNNWHQQEAAAIIFSGRISTRRWTMVVKGTIEEVLVFILPADKLIGFALSHKNFKPYFAMTPEPDKLDVHWRIEDVVMPTEVFPAIYKELFDGLIRFAREEARLDETFSLKQIGIVPAVSEEEQEDIKPKDFYQEQFFQDMHSRQDPPSQVPNFAKPDQSAAETTGGWKPVGDGSRPAGPDTRSVYERMAEQVNTGAQQPSPRPNMQQPPQQPQMPQMPQMPLQPRMPQQQMPPQQMPHQQMPHQQMPHQQMPQQQMPHQQMPHQQMPHQQMPQQQMPHQQMPQQQMPQQQMPQQQMPQQQMPQQQMPQQQMPQQQSPTNQFQDLPPALQPRTPKPPNFPESLMALCSVLDRELEIVAKAGSDAFAQRDLARADAALKFSGRLTEFRTLARELLEYYGCKPNT